MLSFGAPEIICSCMDAFETIRDNLDVDENLIDKTLYIINVFHTFRLKIQMVQAQIHTPANYC